MDPMQVPRSQRTKTVNEGNPRPGSKGKQGVQSQKEKSRIQVQEHYPKMPGSITNLTASNITTSSLLLRWIAPSGNVGSYRVEVSGPTAQSLTVSTSSFQITGLIPGSNYSLQVVAVAADNVTVGASVSITTFTVPGPVINLTASNITTSSLLLSWTAPSGNVGSYRVEVSGPTAQSLTVSTSSVQITGLSPGSNYSLHVVAVAADNVTEGSPVSITTFTGFPVTARLQLLVQSSIEITDSVQEVFLQELNATIQNYIETMKFNIAVKGIRRKTN
ncbi:receptor-type tyrosine-protein phosphatase eta [Lepisosteus oculatus]|uniref:receptor-type tyrosine-protein phosphatase eta n=1 Tax=Lepisosteus oculatus TaxID=7918 RepID=UPI0035F515E4